VIHWRTVIFCFTESSLLKLSNTSLQCRVSLFIFVHDGLVYFCAFIYCNHLFFKLILKGSSFFRHGRFSSLIVYYSTSPYLYCLTKCNLSIYIVVRTLRRNDVSMLQVTGTFSLRNQPWLLLFGFVIVMKLASYFSQSIGVQIASVFNSGIYERLYADYLDGAVVVNINLIMMRVLSFTLGPIFEELLFRGYLLNKWSAKYGVGKAVVLSSMTFSLIHFNPSLYLT